MKKVCLISGGMDSLLIHLMKKDIISEYVYIDYGHAFKQREIAVLDKLPITYTILRLPDLQKDSKSFFFGRNMRFMIAVREKYIDENIIVYFGNNADDNFTDNSREYLSRLEKLINDSYPNTLRIICPLENMTKEEIYAELKRREPSIPYYFCDTGDATPCGKCHSCQAMIDAGLLEKVE